MPGGRIDIEVYADTSKVPGQLQTGLKSASGLASTLGKGLGAAIVAGTAAAGVGLAKVIELGNQYQGNLNELQAVTSATGIEMARVGDLAKELGADMSLPATSAADAAAAMKELAKGGLDLDEAMTAAKGTLQLAAAAQVDAAQAAEIQSDALNQFGLSADRAAHVADVLANTANAASGEVTDIANALKYVGPVAKTVGADIDSVATAIGLIATQGIRGEQAGTSLRGMIASLASPSKPAAEALKTLGIEAFTAQGKFVGLRSITDQLASAKGKLTEAEFTTAAAVAFGNEGMTVASALASTGAKAFDDMAVSVTKAGGAAEVAAAKTQGLGGAWEGFKSQLETTGIEVYEVIDGPLERVVRSAAAHVEDLGDVVVRGLETAIATGEVYGPRLAEAIRSRAAVVADAGRDVLLPLATGAVDPLNTALNTGIGLWDNFTEVLDNAVEGAEPAAEGISAVAQAAADGDGPISAAAAGIGLLGDTASVASNILGPLGGLVGGVASAFASLPGPIQTAAVTLGLVAAFRGRLSDLGQTVRDRVTAPFVRFNETLRLQQALLTGSTGIASAQVGRLGLAFAALEARVPVIGRMADSYRSANQAAQGFVTNQAALVQTASGISNQYTGAANALGRTEGVLRAVAGTAAGAAAALGTGLRAAAGGLVGALGGPFGLALAGAAVGLSLLASRQQEAAARAQEHASHVDALTAALHETNGVVDASVRATQAKALQNDKIADSERTVADAAREAGISLTDLTEATLGNGDALDAIRDKLRDVVEANTAYSTSAAAAKSGRTNDIVTLNDQAQAAQALLDEINGLAQGFDEARQKERLLAEALKNGTASMIDGTDAGRSLASAMGVLSSNTASADDRARALRDALEALSGGSISLEAAQFRVQDVLARIRDLFGENIDKTKGWGKELLNTDGSLSGATENGRRLRDALQDLSGSTAEVAQKTYDLAISQGLSIPEATSKAEQAMNSSRQAYIDMAAEMGITADQAAVLADRAGLIPKNVSMLITTPGSDQTKQELALIKGAVDRVPPGKDVHMKTISVEAEKKLEELGFKVTHMNDGTVTIHGNTAPAQSALNNFLAQPATKVVTVVYTQGKSLGIGSAVNYHGNIIPAQGFANGGFAKPFKAGQAQVFPPRLLRITGDRMYDDEAYIPINQSYRSQQLLSETASRMGYDLIRRFAVGGFASSGGATTHPVAALPFDGLAITGRLVVDASGMASLVDARIDAAQTRTAQAIAHRRTF
jgi:TP901 family phage tail tape measure protein